MSLLSAYGAEFQVSTLRKQWVFGPLAFVERKHLPVMLCLKDPEDPSRQLSPL